MITKKDALYAVQSIYPNAKNAKKINKGYSHEIFEVETREYPEKVIVKITENEKDTFCLKKEERIHKLIQEKGIPCPRIIYLDDSKKRIPYHFMILSYAEGVDLETIWEELSKKEQEKLSEKMGELLGKIHTTKFDKIGYIKEKGIREQWEFSLKQVGDSRKINPFSLEIISDTLSDMGRIVLDKKFDKNISKKIINYLIDNQHLAESFEEPSLIHGDFSIINIRVKKIKGEWKICSLLDFEYAASMQREYDFIKLHREGFFNKCHLKENLLKGYTKYHPLPERFEEKIKFLRITRDLSFLGLLYKIGNAKKAKEVLDYVMKEINSSSHTSPSNSQQI